MPCVVRECVRVEPCRLVHTFSMGSDVSRNGKIGAGVVLFLVLAVVAVLAVGSAVGWYDEEPPQSLGPPPGQKERVSRRHDPPMVNPKTASSSPAGIQPRNFSHVHMLTCMGKKIVQRIEMKSRLKKDKFCINDL